MLSAASVDLGNPRLRQRLYRGGAVRVREQQLHASHENYMGNPIADHIIGQKVGAAQRLRWKSSSSSTLLLSGRMDQISHTQKTAHSRPSAIII